MWWLNVVANSLGECCSGRLPPAFFTCCSAWCPMLAGDQRMQSRSKMKAREHAILEAGLIPVAGICGHLIYVDTEMEMRACSAPGLSDSSDRLSLRYVLTFFYFY